MTTAPPRASFLQRLGVLVAESLQERGLLPLSPSSPAVVAPSTEQKFHLSAVDVSLPLRGPAPWASASAYASAEGALQAYRQSPWPHVRFLRLCSVVASLTFSVMAKRASGQLEDLREDYPLWQLLRRPNPLMRGWDFRFLTELYVRATGEAFWRKVRLPGLRRVRELWVIPPHWVRTERDPVTKRPVSYQIRSGAGMRGETVGPEEMLWLRTPDPLDPYATGIGDMLAVATEVETFEYASEADRRLMQNDGTPPGYLKLPEGAFPDQTEIDRIRDDWARKYGGWWNRGSIPILSGGMSFEGVRQTRQELDFLDGQRWLRDVILAGLPPEIVGVVENSNRATAEAAEYAFGRWEILPRKEWWEEIINEELAPDFDPQGRAIVVFENPVPANRELRAKEALEPTAGQVMRRNERRERLGLPPVPEELDTFIMDLRFVETTGNEQVAAERPSERAASEVGAEAVGAILRRQLDPEDIGQILPALDEEARAVLEDLGSAYQRAMEGRWEQAAGEVGLAAGFDVRDPRVVEFLEREAGRRITGITETTLAAVRDTLGAGVGAGESIPQLAERIGAVFAEARGPRAMTIARTETMTASNRAAILAYKDSGVVEGLEWLLAPDYTPDVDGGECEPFDGKVVELGQEFAPGIDQPPLHPNCRCAVAPVMKARTAPEEPAEDRAADAAMKANEKLNGAFGEFVDRAGVVNDAAFERHLERLLDSMGAAGLDPVEMEEVRRIHVAWAANRKTPMLDYLAALREPTSAAPAFAELAAAHHRWHTEALRKAAGGAQEIIVYRGLGGTGDFGVALRKALDEGGGRTLLTQGADSWWQATSWTTDARVAAEFAGGMHGSGLVVQATVRVEDVLASSLLSPGWKTGYLAERELVVQLRKTGMRLEDRTADLRAGRLPRPKKDAPLIADLTRVEMPAEESSWHRRGRKPADPTRYDAERRRGRRLYDGAARAKHITALGVAHSKYERLFLNAWKRAMQNEQNRILRRLRRERAV